MPSFIARVCAFSRLMLVGCVFVIGPVARAADECPPADFAGKFVCVEDADNAWPLSKVHVVKVGGKEFIVGDMVPPAPEPEVEGEAQKAKNTKEDSKEAAGRKDKALALHLARKAASAKMPKHRRIMLPLDKVADIQVFDSREDLNLYYNSLEDAAQEGDEATVY